MQNAIADSISVMIVAMIREVRHFNLCCRNPIACHKNNVPKNAAASNHMGLLDMNVIKNVAKA